MYRYGGDEFLVICPCKDTSEFEQKFEMLKQGVAGICIDGCAGVAHFSAGYCYGTPTLLSDLRTMIRIADENLYASKDAGKNCVTGCEYEHKKGAIVDSHLPAARASIDS